MKGVCGADCSICPSNKLCKGCEASNCKPFGKSCIASQYIKVGGMDAYNEFKSVLLAEINNYLSTMGIPKANGLCELAGEYVNLPYVLPSGETVKMLDDKKIYLGTQIEFSDLGVCYGVVADTDFIMVCSYSVDGSEPELLLYKKR